MLEDDKLAHATETKLIVGIGIIIQSCQGPHADIDCLVNDDLLLGEDIFLEERAKFRFLGGVVEDVIAFFIALV